MLVQDKSFTWNLGGTGHKVELLLLSLWLDWFCSPFHPAPRVLDNSTKMVVDWRRNSLYEGSEMFTMAAGSDK